MVVCPDWVHSDVTSANFGLVPCLGLWLLGGITCYKSSLDVAQNLDTSGHLPWRGRGTYLVQGGEGYLPWTGGGNYLAQVMPQAVCVLKLPAGGLSCLKNCYGPTYT